MWKKNQERERKREKERERERKREWARIGETERWREIYKERDGGCGCVWVRPNERARTHKRQRENGERETGKERETEQERGGRGGVRKVERVRAIALESEKYTK